MPSASSRPGPRPRPRAVAWVLAGLTAAIGALAWAAPAAAQAPSTAWLSAPWADAEAAVDTDRDVVRAAAVGLPDERMSRLGARRAAARRAADARARQRLHAWADRALARITASASTASAVHAAIDARATILNLRPRADGGVVIELSVPLDVLRASAPQGGLPWSH